MICTVCGKEVSPPKVRLFVRICSTQFNGWLSIDGEAEGRDLRKAFKVREDAIRAVQKFVESKDRKLLDDGFGTAIVLQTRTIENFLHYDCAPWVSDGWTESIKHEVLYRSH